MVASSIPGRGTVVFAQLMSESLHTSQWAVLTPKIVPFHEGSGPTYNTWFLRGPPESTTQTAS